MIYDMVRATSERIVCLSNNTAFLNGTKLILDVEDHSVTFLPSLFPLLIKWFQIIKVKYESLDIRMTTDSE